MEALKVKLVKLECHFTWALNKDHADLSDLQTRLEDQIKLDLGKRAGAARGYCFLGYVSYLQGFSDDALVHLQRAEELIREYHEQDCERYLVVTYGNFAWLNYHRSAFTECESYVERAKDIQKKFSTSPDKPLAEVYGEKGWTFLKFAHCYYEKAEECFKKALELKPDDSELNTGYAIALYRNEVNQTELKDSKAVKQLRRAIEKDPSDPVLMLLLGLRLAVYKKYDDADKLVEEAFQMDPENPHVIRYAGKYFRHYGYADRSIALLKRAIKRSKNSAFLHHQLALCYKRKKNDLHACDVSGKEHEISRLLQLCIYHLEQAISLKSNFVFAMGDLAVLYGESKDISRAEEMFHNAFTTAKKNHDNLQVLHMFYGQFQLYSNKCNSLAVKHYKECILLGHDTWEGKRAIAVLIKMAEKRCARDSRDGEAFGILGFVHKVKGEKQLAIQHYEKALQCDLENAEYLSELCSLRLSLQ